MTERCNELKLDLALVVNGVSSSISQSYDLTINMIQRHTKCTEMRFSHLNTHFDRLNDCVKPPALINKKINFDLLESKFKK